MNTSAAGSRTGPLLYQPHLYRRFAELLVDGGFITRREVEVALREARRARQPLSRWLACHQCIPAHYLTAVIRIERLLVGHGSGLRLADLLVDSGEISRIECKRVLETRQRTGRTLGDILVSEGLLGRPKRPRYPMLSKEPLAIAASSLVALVCAWGILNISQSSKEPGLANPAPANSIAHRSPSQAATSSSKAVDLRFTSLGDITPHLQRLRQRPGPYRAPPALTGTVRQRITKLRPLVNRYAKKYQLPPELILAVIEKESSFDANARSKRNGVGLMQLVPTEGGQEAYHFSERKPGIPTLRELQDPNTNIRLGTAYMRLLLDRHFDDIEDEDVRVAVALAAYNWGPTRLRKVMERHGMPDSVDEVETLLKRHAPRETQNYVRDITFRMDDYG